MNLSAAITAGFIMLSIMLGGYSYSVHLKNESLKIDVKNRDQAIKAYEQMLKTVPFNAIAKERKINAKEDINETLSNTDAIMDNLYRL